MPRILTNVLLVLVSILISLLAVEGLFRLTSLRAIVDNPREPDGYYQEHPERAYDITPDMGTSTFSFFGNNFLVWSNHLGCFDRPYGGERPFIYLAGDSFTWGYSQYEEKWGTLLDRSIGERVLTCGVNATGTFHQYLKAREILSQYPHPDLIIVGYLWLNDIYDDYKFPLFTVVHGQRMDNPNPGVMPNPTTRAAAENVYANYENYCTTSLPSVPWLVRVKCLLFRHSITYNLSKQGIKAFLRIVLPASQYAAWHVAPEDSTRPLLSPPPEAWAVHRASIARMQQLAAQQGAPLLFVIIPIKEEVYPEVFGSIDTFEKKRVMDFLAAQGIPFVDLLPAFQSAAATRAAVGHSNPSELYWDHDMHWTPRGNLVAAGAVLEYLYDHQLIPASANASNTIEELRLRSLADESL